MSWIADKSGQIWDKTTNAFSGAKEIVSDGSSDIVNKTRGWLIDLFIKAIQSCSAEQDRLEVISWLALNREVLADESLALKDKAKKIYQLADSKKTAKAVFRGVVKTVENYKNADIPLPVKIAIPATLGAAVLVGGHGIGLAAFGGAVGMPILIMIFLGTAGITAIIESFLGKSAARDYISVVVALIAADEVLRRANNALNEAMTSEVTAPKRFAMPAEEKAIIEKLATMDCYDFEHHIMSFFLEAGIHAWVTQKSNDAGADGFAKHPSGLIVVQCKHYAPSNHVGRPNVQQFKGVIEETGAWLGYVVTTSYFSAEAEESASKSDKIILADIDDLVEWHTKGFSFPEKAASMK